MKQRSRRKGLSMHIDAPSQSEFDYLKNRFEAVVLALLNQLGLEEKQCEHPSLETGDRRYRSYSCPNCKGAGIVFRRKA